MKKYYIPTSSLNFNNILSSESVSPKNFYKARAFGYSRWTSIPENPFENSIVLYNELCSFCRPVSDYEDHPLLIEVTLEKDIESTLLALNDHMFLCNQTVYIDPFSSRLIFFTEEDKRIALSLSESSLETKFVRLYLKKIDVVVPPATSYTPIETQEGQTMLNSIEIEKDKRINRMKGLLYGYYIGGILSSSKEDIVRLNKAREIYNIQAAILASLDHKATPQQREKLKALYADLQPPIPFLSKLATLVSEKPLFNDIVALVREEYGEIRGELDIDRIISQLLTAPSAPGVPNMVMGKINSKIKEIESSILGNKHLVSVDDHQIIVQNNTLIQLDVEYLSIADKRLCIAWLNDVLTKDAYNGKISTFKETLSDDITQKAKEICSTEWKGSYPEVTLNALRRHIRGEQFPHSWQNDIYSAISAVIIRGDDWQKLLQYMQSKEMTDYRIAFALYGTICGFANLPRDFTDILFSQDSRYIASVYKEFYRQLLGRDVVISTKPQSNVKHPSAIEKKMSHEKNEDKPCLFPMAISSPTQKREPSQEFSSLMNELCKKCKSAKNDEQRYWELFIQHGGLNETFANAIQYDTTLQKGKGVQKAIKQYISSCIKAKKIITTPKKEELTTSLFTSLYQSTGQFLDDFEFLSHNAEFRTLMDEISKTWEKDLKWFIDAHNPSNKDYSCYRGKAVDNYSIIQQFVKFKKGIYRTAEQFLRNTYHV